MVSKITVQSRPGAFGARAIAARTWEAKGFSVLPFAPEPEMAAPRSFVALAGWRPLYTCARVDYVQFARLGSSQPSAVAKHPIG